MGTYTGKKTIVKMEESGVAIGKVKSVTLDGTVEVIEDEYIGEDGKDVTTGNQTWESSITYHHDPEDAGQKELILGELVDISIYPQGNVNGRPKLTFKAIVTANPNTFESGAKVEKVIPLKVRGIPAETTISIP
jgi:hypothetical protein